MSGSVGALASAASKSSSAFAEQEPRVLGIDGRDFVERRVGRLCVPHAALGHPKLETGRGVGFVERQRLAELADGVFVTPRDQRHVAEGTVDRA